MRKQRISTYDLDHITHHVCFLVLIVLACLNLLKCSSYNEPADAGPDAYGIHYPDHPDASTPEDPALWLGGRGVPPWLEKQWLVDPAP